MMCDDSGEGMGHSDSRVTVLVMVPVVMVI